jgi:FkbH-like protein
MTLNEALALIREHKAGGQERTYYLACGCQPLHLATFLQAYLLLRFPNNDINILTGLFADLLGNLRRAAVSGATAATVVIEWSDLDPRLGLRSSGGWSRQSKKDILLTCAERLPIFADSVRDIALRMPISISPPNLPVPPIGGTTSLQASDLDLELENQISAFLLQLSRVPAVTIIRPPGIRQPSLAASCLDANMELLAGFPYSSGYASELARSWVNVLHPPSPKRGLITDLDDTLWAGIVGEVGASMVSWDQEHHTQAYGLYQQMLGHLADCGVLLGVCSKNEPAVVREALSRSDLLLECEKLFPICSGWGSKSSAVTEVLRVWNIGEDAVVFIDDNPMELSEVRQAHPHITCLQFPCKNPSKVWELLGQLRELFAKPFMTEEDRVRSSSIRAGAWAREVETSQVSENFLRSLNGFVTVDYRKNPSDPRPLELINKTNQFNLNGTRISDGEWRNVVMADKTVIAVVSYQDKFGPLGRVATLVGKCSGDCFKITHWAMSCRAFSRHLEHHTLDSVFRRTGVAEIEFAFHPTERNQPLQEFFQSIKVRHDGPGRCRLSRSQFLAEAGALPHQTSEEL